MRNALKTAIIALFAASLLASAAQAGELKVKVDDEKGRDNVRFESRATLETIIGTGNQVTGWVTTDPNDIENSSEGEFVVDLASLQTGISLRDKHMREKYLQTDQYPKMTFKLTRVTKASSNSLKEGEPVEVEADGKVQLHGITRTVPVSATVTFVKASDETESVRDGDLLVINANFEINLSDFDIQRPKMVFLKVSDKIKISVDVVGYTGAPEAVQ